MLTCRVVAVDVGSVRGNFAWAALDLPGRRVAGHGDDPEGASQCASEGLSQGIQVALGLESPLAVPVPHPDAQSWERLGLARPGEGNRPWSAGAGSGALATGLAQLAWMCQRIKAVGANVTATTQPSQWLVRKAQLLIWEAFVSGPGKPPPGDVGQHAADAAIAAITFAERLDSDQLAKNDVACDPHQSFNLAYAAAAMGGITIDARERTAPVTVLRTPPSAS